MTSLFLRLVRFAVYWYLSCLLVGAVCRLFANEDGILYLSSLSFLFLKIAPLFCFLLLVLFDSFYSTRRRNRKSRLYANIIRDGARQIDAIAAATGLPYDVVKKDLRKLVKKGKDIFQNAYFNEATQEIRLVDFTVQRRKIGAKTRLYANIIRDGARRVDAIAAATGLPYDVVKKDLRKFAKKGEGDFQGTYFNEATQEIIFTRNVPAANSNNAPANAPAQPAANSNNAPAQPAANSNNAPTQPAAPRNVCPACGASVAGVGRGGVCEYCGSPLN